MPIYVVLKRRTSEISRFPFWQYSSLSIWRVSWHHDDSSFVECRCDNLQSQQWWQSWHYVNSRCSEYVTFIVQIWSTRVCLHDDMMTWRHFPLYWPLNLSGIPITKYQWCDVWCFLWCRSEQAFEQTGNICLWFKTPLRPNDVTAMAP